MIIIMITIQSSQKEKFVGENNIQGVSLPDRQTCRRVRRHRNDSESHSNAGVKMP